MIKITSTAAAWVSQQLQISDAFLLWIWSLWHAWTFLMSVMVSKTFDFHRTYPWVHDEFPFCSVAEVNSCFVGCIKSLVGDGASLQRKYTFSKPVCFAHGSHIFLSFLLDSIATYEKILYSNFHLVYSNWTVLELRVVGHDILNFFSLKEKSSLVACNDILKCYCLKEKSIISIQSLPLMPKLL